MKNLIIATAVVLLAGCAGIANRDAPGRTQYDFGPLPARPAASVALPALVLPNVVGPAALDNQRMQYRLLYADPLQARHYAHSHWASTPLQLITQRLRSRIAQGGARVLAAPDAASGSYLLRVEAEEFLHQFDSASSSAGVLRLRASLLDGSRLLDQRTFARTMPARSQDAPGGAHALAAAMDAVGDEMVAWIASVQASAQGAAR